MTRPARTPRRSPLRYARLTWFLGGVSLRRLVAYRTDFLLGGVGFLLRVGVQVLLIGSIFQLVPTVGGWSLDKVLFLLGFALLPRGLDRLFTDYLWVVAWQLIRSGDFYRHLIRPVNPLFSVLSERFFWPDALGELLVGFALLGYAGRRLGLDVDAEMVLVGAGLVVCGTLIYTGIKLIFASIAFWTITSQPAMHAANQLSEFAAFPLEIYPGVLRHVLTWVLPFAFTAYIPVEFLLGGDGRLVWLTPLVAAGALCVGYGIWSMGIRRYEMTGS
ncbi:ABC-2 family transporter protein [Micromonospora sp. NPDC002389]|uniref:ABC transporter permease n=1 Tax=Micromonospora sp. NPDC002389 TaxID=3154272 RepID=UPI00332C13FC